MPYKDPARQREYKRRWQQERRHGTRGTPDATLERPQDVLRILDQEIQAVRADPRVGAVVRARVMAQLAAIALRAVEAGPLADRLEAIETALPARRRTL